MSTYTYRATPKLAQLLALRDRITAEIAAEREAIKQANRKRRLVAVCGTDSGYYRHNRTLRDLPCEPCLRAHARAVAQRESRKRATS